MSHYLVNKDILDIVKYLSTHKVITMLDLNATVSVQWLPGTSEVITTSETVTPRGESRRCAENPDFVSLWITGVTPLVFINFAMMKN